MHPTTAFDVTPEFVFTESEGRVTVAKFGLVKERDGTVTRVPYMVGQFDASDGGRFTMANGEAFDAHDPETPISVTRLQCARWDWKRLRR